ncbi:hypothetical protein [Vibrio penaeicida]|uniref:hypothetical protein n=1 Tax=Vibrio penaeicida TaxID=104609 RepID=UPI001CC39B9C|nr:hypothetical protein [Vibrio penaeicida]
MAQLYLKEDREAIQLVISLLKYYVKDDFIELMTTDWKAEMSANETVIQTKIGRIGIDNQKLFDRELQNDVAIMLFDLLERAQMSYSEFDTDSMKTSLTLGEYNTLHQFICSKAKQVCEQQLDNTEHQSTLFYFHEHLRVIINVLLARSTIQYGFERESLNAVYQTLINTKSPQFFARGYVFDLLVHDRYEAHNDSELSALLINPSYLSTHLVRANEVDGYSHMMLCEV